MCVPAAVLVAVGLLGAVSANAAAARSAKAPGWGLLPSLSHPTSVAHRLMAARRRRAERATMRRHGGATAASPRAAHPDIMPHAIAGTVIDASTKEAVPNIEVCAYELEPSEEGPFEEEAEPPCATVSEAGEYELSLQPGEYIVEFLDPRRAPVYATQLFNDQTLTEAEELQPTVVDVKAKVVTQHIDAELVKGGAIEGAVTAREGGKGLTGLLVCAFDHLDAGCAETGSGGSYDITGLSTGSYTVLFFVPAISGENYLDEPVHGVAVTAGEATSGTNAALPPGGTIEGTVTDAADGESIADAEVCAYSFPAEEFQECALTDSSGTYTLERLDAGTDFVEFFDEPFYATQFWDGTPTGTPLSARAVPLSVLPPASRTGIDAEMLRPEEAPAGPPIVEPPVTQTTPTAPAGVPGGSVLSTRSVVPSLAAGGRVQVAGRRATLKLSCALGPCVGTVHLSITVVRRHRVDGRTVVRRVSIVVGSATFSLAQGATAGVTIHLTSQGKSLLASAARHPRSGQLELTLHGASTSDRSVVIR